MRLSLLAFFVCFGSVAHAQTTPSLYSKQFQSCLDKSGGGSGSYDCMSKEMAIQDKKLNDAYKKLTASITPERKKLLLTAQRTWINFRDSNCAFHVDPDGGQIGQQAGPVCELEYTALRAKELLMLSN